MRRWKLRTFICAACMTAAMPFCAYGAWEGPDAQTGVWRWRKEDLSWQTDSWIQPEGEKDWYYLGSDGSMIVGWYQIPEGVWYYFHPSGQMAYGAWVESLGRWYYLGSDGVMLTDQLTPDGYYVDRDGAWKDTSGGGVPYRFGNKGTGGGSGFFSQVPGKAPDSPPLETLPPKQDRDLLEQYKQQGIFMPVWDKETLNREMDQIVLLGLEQLVLIGRDSLPMPSRLTENRYQELQSYESQIISIPLEEGTYYVNIIQLTYRHKHQLVSNRIPPGCTTEGQETVACLSCQYQSLADIPSLGHEDSLGDLICDRCGQLAKDLFIGQQQRLKTGLSHPDYQEMTFTCVDDDYQSGYLFLADQVIPRDFASYYHDTDNEYHTSYLRDWLNQDFLQELSIAPFLVPISLEPNQAQTDLIFCLSQEEVTRDYPLYALKPWQSQSGGGSWWTRSKDEDSSDYAFAVSAQGDMTSKHVFDLDTGVRPAYVIQRQKAQQLPDRMWKKGDRQIRSLDGKPYSFTCIDQSYVDTGGQVRGALFLCDQIASASNAAMADFSPALWPGAEDVDKSQMVQVPLTTERSYFGYTEGYGFSIGDFGFTQSVGQKRQGYLFSLSLQEAARYQEDLWRLQDGRFDQPVSGLQGYWLRDVRAGTDDSFYAVMCDGVTGPVRMDQRAIGFRPAFVAQQHP